MPSAGDSIALTFPSTSALYQTVQVTADDLAQPDDVLLNRISLNAGDTVTASVNTAPYGGGLNSYLRIFQDMGGGQVRPIASNDNFQGLDPGLTFQAPSTGIYYVGVSSFDNTAYNPAVADSGTGSSHGLFDLTLSKTTAALAPDLVGASFQVSPSLAVWGDTVTVPYTIENRGGLGAAASTVSLLLSADNRFDDGLQALQTAAVPALPAGNATAGSFTVTLGAPGTPLAPFQDSQEIFLGLQIGSALPSSPEQGNDWAPVQMLTAETAAASGSNRTLGTAQAIALNSRTSNITLPAGGEAFFQIALTQSGNVNAQVAAAGGLASLALYDATGIPIVQSDGQSAANPDPSITHALTGSSDGTTYYLKVASRGPAACTCTLTTLFTPSASTLQTIPVGAIDGAIVSGDFTGDGRLDLITANSPANNVTVFLNNGDGTFQNAGSINLGFAPQTLVAGDFNGDGRLDLAAAAVGEDVVVLLGNGDGTFQSPITLPVLGGPALGAGDFTGDGRLDLAVGDPTADTVTVLLNNGHGGFQAGPPISVPAVPAALATGDFSGDGRLDLAVVDETTNQVTVLLNNGDGTFQTGVSVDVGKDPVALVTGDFNGDGQLDLAVADHGSNNVTVLAGDGHGSFQAAGTFAVGGQPHSLVTGDFTGDGRVDLATADLLSNDVTVLLNNGDGTFQSAASVAVGTLPNALVAGDFNGDGHVDLAVANTYSQDVTLLLGQGDGTFLPTGSPNATGAHPDAIVQGDFTGDGHLDLAVANSYSGDVSVLLGQGDGTFQSAGTYATGLDPVALVTGDFNGDGRLDLAVANYQGKDVTILLGQGDGTFQKAATYPVPGMPAALVAGDFDEDSALDLAVALKFNADSSQGSSVMLLLGDGRGAFTDGGSFTVGIEPDALVAGHFAGDAHLDLAVGDYNAHDVAVLLGNGDGTFRNSAIYPVQGGPVALVAGDFSGDTYTDLAVATNYYSGVTVLLNNGDGTFHDGATYNLGTSLKGLVAGNFNGDGNLDLAATNYLNTYYYSPANKVTVLLGDGHGGFQQTGSFITGARPEGLVAGDFNGDGRLDLAVANEDSSDVTTLLGTGTGSFLSPVLAPSPVQSTPLVADLTAAGVPDAVVLTATGEILFRQGLPTEPGAFAPPVVINPDPQLAARDLAFVQTSDNHTLLAALDAQTFTVAGTTDTPLVTVYQPFADGTFRTLANVDLPAGFLPAQIASADLTGDGLGDLVITAAASDQVFVVLQTSSGVFGPPTPYSVGVNPSAIDLVDVNGDRLPDIEVTDQFSGQVSVLLNLGNGVFGPEERFDAGTGLYGLAPVNNTEAVQSLEGTNGVVAGPFIDGTGTDLVVINSGTDSFTVLPGDGSGGFLNPQAALTTYLGTSPTAIVAGHFITGDNNLDLAILSKDSGTIAIYCGDGQGGFTLFTTVAAGNQPTGLAVADVSRQGGGGPDGIADLLVGNAFGDLLILPGNRNGTFGQYVRVDQSVSLAVATAPAPVQNVFYFSDQENDQLAYKPATPGTPTVSGPTPYQDRSQGILAPGPQAIVTVDGTQYLAVVNSGANQLLIYTLSPDGQPDPGSKQIYFTGTDPVSVTIVTGANDLNGDTIPDVVVANEGSNDVSVFLGQIQMTQTGEEWKLEYRPRQSSGGVGPTSVAITPGSTGQPDLLVSNGASNDVGVLADQGGGYFVNRSVLETGSDPVQVLVGPFDGTGGLDLLTVNTGSNNLTLIANFLTDDPVTSTIATGGTVPVAAVAVETDAINELLVANAGNSVLGLLQPGPDGLDVTGTLDEGEGLIPHLSDLALVAAGNELDVYGTGAGNEAAVLLETFGAPPPPISPYVPALPGQGEYPLIVPVAGNPGTTSPAANAPAPEAGPAAQFLVNVLPAVNPVNPPAALEEPALLTPPSPLLALLALITSSPVGGSAEGFAQEAEAGPQPREQLWGNGAGILLLNLPESPQPNAADVQAPGEAVVPEMDLLEPALENAPSPTGGVALPASSAAERMTHQDHPLTSAGQSVTRLALRHEGEAPAAPLPRRGQAGAGPGSMAQARTGDASLAVRAPRPETTVAAPAGGSHAPAGATTLWYTLSLMVSPLVDVVQRPRRRLASFLRKVWIAGRKPFPPKSPRP